MSFQFTEKNMVNLVARNQSLFCTSYDMLIPNCYTQNDNEADLFAIRKSGFCDEFEIKISRADFFNDARKIVNYRKYDHNPHGHSSDSLWSDEVACIPYEQKKKMVAPWQKLKYDALIDGDMSTNYFWYILKKGIVSLDEIPEFAGVFFVRDDGELIRARQPKKLHKNKIEYKERYRLSRKICYRFWDLRLNQSIPLT